LIPLTLALPARGEGVSGWTLDSFTIFYSPALALPPSQVEKGGEKLKKGAAEACRFARSGR